MKKFLLLIVFLYLFVITGCSEEKEDKKFLFNLSYKDEVKIGSYNEPITWIVLDDINAPDGTVLLISKDIIDVKMLNDNEKEVSFEDSSLNKWLNDEFINKAFKEDVKEKIIINYDADEKSKITILSSSQLERYLPTDEYKIAEGTKYAFKNGLDSTHWYWTKTPCRKDKYAYEAVNGSEGWIRTGGLKVTDKNVGVRPAMWIKDDLIIE